MVCVELRGVCKKYTRNQDRSRSLTAFLRSAFSGKGRSELWALRDIDLEVQQGERIAVLGHNGSGKTTLIRLIARTLVPTLGEVNVVGKVAPLVSFTSGFDMRLSGYDNAFLRASMFGMSRSDIDSLLPEVVSFAGLEEAIDFPVETYSSGMVSRLGFSLSLHLQADIYLMDEGLSTGDSAFQAKARQAMSERIRGHGTWVVATHDPKMAAEFCTRGIVLQGGRVCAQGSIEELERAGLAF